jgi:hypothetical protein
MKRIFENLGQEKKNIARMCTKTKLIGSLKSLVDILEKNLEAT